MATQKQIDANRRNAQKSTGPRTPEGKAAVALNALKHGMRARTVVLPGEDRQAFNQLCDNLEGEWQPRTATEMFYLEQMVVSQWKLARMEVGEGSVYREIPGAKVQMPLLLKIWAAQHTMERSFARAQRELERIQSSRSFQAQQPPDDLAAVPDQPGEPQPAEEKAYPAPQASPAHFAKAANCASQPTLPDNSARPASASEEASQARQSQV